jgi:hypothetical protein
MMMKVVQVVKAHLLHGETTVTMSLSFEFCVIFFMNLKP